jgi:transposase-like protein
LLVNYPETFKEKMVLRMSGPERISANALSEEIGVPQSSLSRWLREASGVDSVAKNGVKARKGKVGKRPQDWTAQEKLEAVMESASLSEQELGEYLRRKGLHEVQLEQELRRKEKALAETAALLVLKKKAAAIWGDEDDSTESKNGK